MFRGIEKQKLQHLVQREPAVIATGGGAVIDEGTRNMLADCATMTGWHQASTWWAGLDAARQVALGVAAAALPGPSLVRSQITVGPAYTDCQPQTVNDAKASMPDPMSQN